ncbi:MAG: hypothetical protein GYB68_18530, partial [Chloroflexi bacterium]|nr:hypothetical protein [Chloroflexota bacterium]
MKRVFAVVAALLLVAMTGTLAQAGVDTTFGTDGITKVAGVDGLDQAYGNGIDIAADGDILIAGRTSDGSVTSKAWTASLGSDGSLDSGYGSGGVAVLSDNGTGAVELFELPDGKILVGINLPSDMGVMRLNADGSLDTSFGSNGIVTVSFGDLSTLNDLYVDFSSGKIYGVGEVLDESTFTSSIGVFCLTSDGALDPTFNDGLVYTTTLGDGDPSGGAMAVDSSGNVLIAVANSRTGNPDRVGTLFKLAPDGMPDSSFGDNGSMDVVVAGKDVMPRDVEIKNSTGEILVTGYAGIEADKDGFVAKFDSSGQFDANFGTGGVSLPDSTHLIALFDLLINPAGGYYVSGTANFGTSDNAILAALDNTGALDSSFGNGGYAEVRTGSDLSEETLVKIVFDGGNRIIGVGTKEDPSESFSAVAIVVAFDVSTGDVVIEDLPSDLGGSNFEGIDFGGLPEEPDGDVPTGVWHSAFGSPQVFQDPGGLIPNGDSAILLIGSDEDGGIAGVFQDLLSNGATDLRGDVGDTWVLDFYYAHQGAPA